MRKWTFDDLVSLKQAVEEYSSQDDENELVLEEVSDFLTDAIECCLAGEESGNLFDFEN